MACGAALAFGLLLGCHCILQATPELIASWTVSLRDAQPDDAFSAVYRFRRSYLVFVGAHHATRADSLTFQIIKDAYASFAFRLSSSKALDGLTVQIHPGCFLGSSVSTKSMDS
jgi:hypothetical protein